MRLVFFGPPGAGKGTQAALLSKNVAHMRHLSSGDLLREAARRCDATGEKIAGCIRLGALVPDALITGLMLERIGEVGKEGFILDGFPRTLEQAQALDAALCRPLHPPVDLAVDFEVSSQKVLERLSGRRVCAQCGANYHVVTLPPRRADQCDQCGGNLIGREDDEPQTILRRLRVYTDATLPLLDFYKRQKKLRKISGELDIEGQYHSLCRLLKEEGLLKDSKG